MPTNSKTTKGKSRKQNRSNRASRITGLRNSRCLLPAMFRGKMYYNTVLSIAPSAGSCAFNVFRWNGIYDPDYTGTGTSVVGWSSMSALYSRHRVLAASAQITFQNASTSVPLTVILALNPANTIGVGITQILAQRHVWSRGIGVVGGTSTITHRISAPVHLIYGVPRNQVRNEDDFAAVGSGSPNNTVFLHVGAYADSGSAGALNVHVSIEYDVVWSLPLEMT